MPPFVKNRGATATPALDELPLRPELVGEKPYGAPQLDVAVCLNVNENPYPPSEQVISEIAAAVAEAGRSMNRYPERDALDLREDLARYLGHGLTAEQIWAANGSNEVMLHVLLAFAGPGRRVLSFAPTYSMYPEYARDTHSEWCTFPRRDDFTIDPDAAITAMLETRPDVVLITSPNNPTGTAISLATIRAICDVASGVVVADEAYYEFARGGTPSALELLPQYPRLAVSRTMSKAFAFAGGRLGYLAAAPAFIEALQIVRLPYHLSALTQAAARVALAHAPRDAGQSRSASAGPRRPGPLARQSWTRGCRIRRQLRPLRAVLQSARGLAGPARPRGSDSRDRTGRVASGVGRYTGGDAGLQRRAGGRARNRNSARKREGQ